MQTDILLDIEGGTVFVRRWNPAVTSSEVPLVLLHDSLGCVELWRDFPAALARQLGRLVVAYDRLGFGRSSPRTVRPGPDFIREVAEKFLPAVLGGLGIADFALFGHSVGGSMALVAAAHAGGRCRAVVSESVQAFVEDRTLEGVRAARTKFEDPEQFGRLRRWHGEKARWVLDAWTGVWLSPGFASWSLGLDLSRVKCPVLLIHGDQDEYGSARFPEFIRDRVSGPVEMHVLGGCGHVPHRERPDVVAGLVSRFPRCPPRKARTAHRHAPETTPHKREPHPSSRCGGVKPPTRTRFRSIRRRSFKPLFGFSDSVPTCEADETVVAFLARRCALDGSTLTAVEVVSVFAARFRQETAFRDVKEIVGAGQQQVRYMWASVGSFHLCLWTFTMTEAWAWGRDKEGLVAHRSASPWDDKRRRPSHADKRRAWRRELLTAEIHAVVGSEHNDEQIRDLAERLLDLAA